MPAVRRLLKELSEIRQMNVPSFRIGDVKESNILTWEGYIIPSKPPYNHGNFRIEINFPPDYPFRPPQIMFKTKIYHPNIDERGQVCLPIIKPEHWLATTTVEQIIYVLLALVENPDPEYPLRKNVAEEFTKDRKKFMKNAKKQSRKYANKKLIS